MRSLIGLLPASLMFFASLAPCYAWHKSGKVFCDANVNGVIDEDDVPVQGVLVVVTDGANFTGSAVTAEDGSYYIQLKDTPDTYTAYLDPNTLPKGTTAVDPQTETFTTSGATPSFENNNFLIRSRSCVPNVCWLTGGGAIVDPDLGIPVAEIRPKNNNGKVPDIAFGGNVYPGCSPTAGDGGSWNHINRDLKLHFHGTTIQVVRCGNIDDPNVPPGSDSPKTPFNFIEFQGVGWLKGIHGNKVDATIVYFFARCEDRNEPGSKGAHDGALVDRYYLRVAADANPDTLPIILIGSGNPPTKEGDPDVVPVPITDGNLQLHVSGCDDPPLW